jgi:TPR repeat protein
MANRAYLFNTEHPVRNPFLLGEPGPEGGGKSVQVAEWARAIPVPWLCAFRPEDAHPFTHRHVKYEEREDPAAGTMFQGQVLSAPLARVLENLRAALPVFEKVVGVPQLARAYRDDALKAFSALELPHVLLQAEEVVDGDYERLLAALDGSDAAVVQLKEWSGYGGEKPWEPGRRVPMQRDEDGLWCAFGPEATVPEGDEPGSLDAEAQPWMQAAAGGDAEAQFRIGLLFKQAEESSARDEVARGWLRRAAQQGHVQAQFHLGRMTVGAESLDWSTRAAKAGHLEAQADVAAHFSMEGNSRLAMAWLTRAAESGHAHSAYMLGRIYQGSQPGVLDMVTVQYAGPGEHVPDLGKSVFWLRKAIDAGCREPPAWVLLGEMRFLEGTKDGIADAARWFRFAADAGWDKAQLWLAVLHYHGLGVRRDLAAAARWTRKSADQGSSSAQYALGILHELGHGVPQDHDASRRWMQKAAVQGHQPAREYLALPRWKFWARPGFPKALG